MAIKEKLEIARKELLDLTLRNPLLNYHLLKARGLELKGELPEELFRILVTDRKSMSFLSDENKKENKPNGSDEENLELLEQAYKDQKLQTSYSEKELQSRLLATYMAARTFVEEQGVNILFLALGALLWKDSDDSEKTLRAPLILVPVQLSRSNARERFVLSYTDEEIQSNLSLFAKLSTEFSIKLPLFSDDEDLDVNSYFAQVEKAIVSQKSWSIDNSAISLGFFSFGKFLMYKDLDIASWPEEKNVSQHYIINALLNDGFKEEKSEIDDDEHIDRYVDPKEVFNVVEADSSQVLAVLDADRNRNLVIQGPPGTGKSQTITNIISQAIGKGKKVLFVSEKMAALEVVKRRLDNIGLGDACLELHSHKTNKKAVLSELQRVMELGEPKISECDSEIEKLCNNRTYLNEYCNAVNTPIGNSGVNPYKAYGEVLRIKKVFDKEAIKPPKLNIDKMADWNKTDFDRKFTLIKDFKAHLKNMGMPRNHPFWGSMLTAFLPSDQEILKEELHELKGTLGLLGKDMALLSQALGSKAPANYLEATQLIVSSERAISAPDLTEVDIRASAWIEMQDRIKELMNAGTKFCELHEKYDALLVPEAWRVDVFSLRQSIYPYRDKWWKFLSSQYRRANNQVIGLCRGDKKLSIHEKIELLDAILESNRTYDVIQQGMELGKSLFNRLWNGASSKWTVLGSISEWVIKLYEDINISSSYNNLPILKEVISFLEKNGDRNSLSIAVKQANERAGNYEKNLEKVLRLLEIDSNKYFSLYHGAVNTEFEHIGRIIDTWIKHVSEVQQIVIYNHYASMFAGEGMCGVLGTVEEWDKGSELLDEAFLYEWFQALLSKAFLDRKVLAAFERGQHEYRIEQFKVQDENLLKLNRAKLARQHWTGVPKYSSGDGQLGVLLWEFQKKSRHLPIRQLILKAGNVIQAIKPVMMMSPLSIANFIDSSSLSFDLVVFDEASQVRPVDAFGAILRAKQAVVVGDSCQMPPTSFFDFVAADNDDMEDNYVGDMESILSLFVAQSAPQRMLRWHYRSRHESLIMVSNREFYRSKLVVFPSVESDMSEKAGLVYRYLPHTAYDRGRSRTNIEEAKAVAREVIKHAKEKPELTLGVAAFSMAQMQAIVDQLEILRRADPSCEDFFLGHKEEPFFVKNLENVQGDERDVIYISIGYGKTAEGYLTMDFGPLNRDGGERRLNVLITRARQRCEVFTNLTADDIDLNRTNSRGVQCLKAFLMYAREGKTDLSLETGKEEDSPFEEDVYYSLIEKGYQVRKQIGCAGFFIDLAIVDPRQPGRYLLGIECDGATYHSARSARDRDRLRQKVLEDKGWTIHRIWSTDWFRSPQKELERLIAAIEKAKTISGANIERTKEHNDESNNTIERHKKQSEELERTLNIQEYRIADISGVNDDMLYNPQALSKVIKRIVSVESPVHIQEALRRVLSATNIKRAGSSIQSNFEQAIHHAANIGYIDIRGNFLWAKGMKSPSLRNRKDVPANVKKIEYIADEEILLAIKSVISTNFGMEKDHVPTASCRLLGFSRVTEEMQEKLLALIDKLLLEGKLLNKGTSLIVKE